MESPTCGCGLSRWPSTAVHWPDAVAGPARRSVRLRAGRPGNGARAGGTLAEPEVARGAGRQSRRFHGSHRQGPLFRELVQGHAGQGAGCWLRARRSGTPRVAALPRPHRVGRGHEHGPASRLAPERLATEQGLTSPARLPDRGVEADESSKGTFVACRGNHQNPTKRTGTLRDTEAGTGPSGRGVHREDPCPAAKSSPVSELSALVGRVTDTHRQFHTL